MPIKLNGSTSGYSQLQAAAVAASNTLTLPASNGTILSDDGSGNMTITGSAYLATTSGNVGVGTSLPASNSITNYRASGYTEVRTASGANSNSIGQDASAGYIGTNTNLPLVSVTNGTERTRIDTSGNLQVGGTTVANTIGYVNSRTNTRAWVRWVGSSGAVTASYNVSSVTRNSTGNYTVNFTTSLADANYAPIGMTAGAATYNSYGAYMQQTSAPIAASCAVTTLSNGGVAVDCIANQLVIFGN